MRRSICGVGLSMGLCFLFFDEDGVVRVPLFAGDVPWGCGVVLVDLTVFCCVVFFCGIIGGGGGGGGER